MQVDGKRTYAINFCDDFSIEDGIENFDASNTEHLYEFAKGVGLRN